MKRKMIRRGITRKRAFTEIRAATVKKDSRKRREAVFIEGDELSPIYLRVIESTLCSRPRRRAVLRVFEMLPKWCVCCQISCRGKTVSSIKNLFEKASGQPSKNASVSHTAQMGSDQILGGKGREARLWIGSGAMRSFLCFDAAH